MLPLRLPHLALACVGGAILLSGAVRAQNSDAAVPQIVQEVMTLLEREQPDPDKMAKLNAAASAEIPASLTGPQREAFFRRAEARALVGRVKESIADVTEALKLVKGQDYATVVSRYEQFLQRRLRAIGDFKTAMPIIFSQVRAFQGRQRGRLFTIYLTLVYYYGGLGDLDHADQYARSMRGLLAESQGWPNVDVFRPQFVSNVHMAEGYLLEQRGRHAEAEAIYRASATEMQDALARYEAALKSQGKFFPFRQEYETAIDFLKFSEARSKIVQGRSAEAEIDVREMLLRRLQRLGRNHEDVGAAVSALASVMIAEGRLDEAERLTRISSEIFAAAGFPSDSPRAVANQQLLAQVLDLLHRPDESAKVYDGIDRATAKWLPAMREAAVNETSRIVLLVNTGKTDEAIALATQKRDRERARSGEGSVASGVIRGYLGAALAKAGRTAEAAAELKAAIPVLLSRQDDREDAATAGAIVGQNRFVIEHYLELLARNPSLAADAGAETFGLADRVRNRSVQRALAQASARAAAKDPAMGALARSEQDLRRQLSEMLDNLNAILALPSAERDAKAVADARTRIAKLRTDHDKTQSELARRFPAYANLLNPPPADPAEVRAVLADDETFISFYFGDTASFAWAVPKHGAMQFVPVRLTLSDLDAMVTKLRAALEPQAATISEIPPFDVALAYKLYELILRDIEPSWKNSRNIVMTTNGALGLLPLSLLPTAPAEVDANAEPPFSGHRNVAWLARTHAVTVVPSAASLLALRKGARAGAARDKLIGFGDPIFRPEQPKPAGASSSAPAKPAGATAMPEQTATPADANVTRGIPFARRGAPSGGDVGADHWRLPPLPDTADELRSIAQALGADPAKSLHLGKDANERKVKTTNLAGYRFVAFATHGLMADDLDGLSQPALALSAPKAAGVDGDGLLTMEEILALKLNADWVILSACNTAAGAGAGADAASGLGRAFFYAGARALLVTNWSVHSASARELVTDVFRRLSRDPKLHRSEALRQAMMALADGPGNTDGGFSYAHPLFWAPYTLIGDGG
jgi:CHAT domain-containing protein/tetratricopeptide (TPR) repeat protein